VNERSIIFVCLLWDIGENPRRMAANFARIWTPDACTRQRSWTCTRSGERCAADAAVPSQSDCAGPQLQHDSAGMEGSSAARCPIAYADRSAARTMRCARRSSTRSNASATTSGHLTLDYVRPVKFERGLTGTKASGPKQSLAHAVSNAGIAARKGSIELRVAQFHCMKPRVAFMSADIHPGAAIFRFMAPR